MPGDEWQQFANLRALYGLMYGHPGKKMLFMGGEFGQRQEWRHDGSLDWHVLVYAFHRGVQNRARSQSFISSRACAPCRRPRLARIPMGGLS